MTLLYYHIDTVAFFSFSCIMLSMEYITFIYSPTSPVPLASGVTYFHFKDKGKNRYFVCGLPLAARWGDAPYGFDTIEDWAKEIPTCLGDVIFSDEYFREATRIGLARNAMNNPHKPESHEDWAKRTGIIKT